MPLSTNALYIRSDDVPWLINYLADECGPGGSQGVKMLDDDDAGDDAPVDETGDDAPVCTVDGLGLKWDDAKETLTATALSGPLKDKVWTLSMSNFTAEKWNEVGLYPVPFEHSNKAQKRVAAWHYVERRCAQKLSE